MNPNILDDIVRAQKRGEARGIASICSAHPAVIQAAVRRAVGSGRPLLIESTCNQVNPSGGYTGMTPADFARLVRGIAAKDGLPPERILLGGDHLGPFPWRTEPSGQAMRKAAEMVQAYVRAGFSKIHLDASMQMGDDDPDRPLDVELAARRTAELAAAAESSANPSAPPRYVVGSEVPLPGGAAAGDHPTQVTSVDDARRTLAEMQTAFREANVEAAWERVRALVVQSGVEFGGDFVVSYRPEIARGLCRFVETTPFVFENHSTDYQTRESLKALVRDHFAVLKVGPALTFAYREAVFALAMMENEMVPEADRSQLIETVESAMLRNPVFWQQHYQGSLQEQAFARKYSLSDRVRYYWPDSAVQSTVEKLLANLSHAPLPLSLISQFMPRQYERVRTDRLENTPAALIRDRIDGVLEDYEYACGDWHRGGIHL